MTDTTPGLPAVAAGASPSAAPRRYSIRASLIGLVAACVTPALLVSAFLVYQNYQLHHSRLERDTVLRARTLAAALDRELSGIESGLRVLSTSPALAAGNLADFHQRARDALALQIVDNYVMTDREGRQLVNTLRDWGQPLPMAGTPPELARVFTTGKPVLTGMFMGPITGHLVIAMGVPVFRDGEVAYSLNVGLSPERLASILSRQALPKGWISAVIDGSGTIVARSADAQRFVGEKALPPLLERLADDAEGVIESVTRDGTPVYAGYTPSLVSDWHVVVAAPTATLDAVLYRSIAWVLAGAAAAFAAGLWVALTLGRRVVSSIRQLVDPALSLVSGHAVDHAPATRLKETEAVGQAIVQASRRLSETRHLAEHDPLTGLPNRLLFDALAASRLTEARRHSRPLALLALDLDGFKAVNDLHGHAAGDTVLKAAAARIARLLREADVVARLGGDEFAVLLDEAGTDNAWRVATKLIEVLSAPYDDVTAPVSVSVGIAVYPQAGHTLAELSARADEALYEAKRLGKRRAVLAGSAGPAGSGSTGSPRPVGQ